MTPVALCLQFTDRAAAHVVAAAMAGLAAPPDVVRPDGWLQDGTYWNVDEIGEVRTPVVFAEDGETVVSGGDLLDGWYVNILLRDPPQALLDALAPFIIDPAVMAERPWWRRFG